jgi:para-aminobenzoate synthetase / 4-amino-4-deoxychorismate lyase
VDILIEFEKKPRLFTCPDAVITCSSADELPVAFSSLERYREQGYYLAGFLSYEAGYAFESRLRADADTAFPLLMFGCYRGYELRRLPSVRDTFQVGDLRANVDKMAYDVSIQKIKEHIRRGDVYQITYCIKNHFSCRGSAYALYRSLLRAQPVPYPAYIHTSDFDILSLSPELFLRKQGSSIVTKPMKGTWPRGENFLEDCVAGLRLKYDSKNRAENIMIADLLRNDLGRIGTRIRAPRLFEVDKYATLYQMTSTVTARINPGIRLEQVFSALFPSGSVTGTPKIRAMEIIRDIEPEGRNIYTGAIGYCTPHNDFFFSIPIRTLLIREGKGELGVGGGIVWDSTADGEWAESRLKRAFLDDAVFS